MLTEKETICKLMDQAALFNHYVAQKKYGHAHNIYNSAHEVAVYMDMGEAVLKQLFGDWDSDDGTGRAEDTGLFARWKVDIVNERCCIRQHKAYEDVECRRLGKPVRYYSDEDYCAMCFARKGDIITEERRRKAGIILTVLAEDAINMNWNYEEDYLKAIMKGLKRAEEGGGNGYR